MRPGRAQAVLVERHGATVLLLGSGLVGFVGWLGGLLEKMPGAQFWLLHAGLVGGAGLVFDNLGISMVSLVGRARGPSVLYLNRTRADQEPVEALLDVCTAITQLLETGVAKFQSAPSGAKVDMREDARCRMQ